LVFSQFLWEDQVFEDFLFPCELLHSKADNIFTALNNYLNEHDVSWKKCVGFSTDGAKAMADNKAGLDIRSSSGEMDSLLYPSLVAKRLLEPLHKVFNEVVKIINYIKT
jgi:hypothetical protein